MNSIKCFRDACLGARLDVAPMDELISRDFGGGSSSWVTNTPGIRVGPEGTIVKAEDLSIKEKVALDQATMPKSTPEKSWVFLY